MSKKDNKLRQTTVLLVQRDGKTAIAADGQVTLGQAILKGNAKKLRRIYDGKILTGFAGATADAFTLLSRFEGKLQEYSGKLERAALELGRDWRTDKYLRQLEAFLIVADKDNAFLLSGSGDVISSDEGLLAVGSGGMFALAAARALMKHTQLSAGEIAREALQTAADICIYTNSNIAVEEL